jgi:hypothetical protein
MYWFRFIESWSQILVDFGRALDGRRAPANDVHHDAHQEQHQKDYEQDLSDAARTSSNPTKSENGGDNRHHKKDQSPL